MADRKCQSTGLKKQGGASRLLLAILLAAGFWAVPSLADPSQGAVQTEQGVKVLLAEVASAGVNPSGYLVSEKLDGVRAVWDGRQLWTRSGRPISAPRWFTEGWPAVPLDGELWMGHNTFEQMSALVRRQTGDDAGWHRVRYMLFELPGDKGGFSERVAALHVLVAQSAAPTLAVIEQSAGADQAQLHARLQEVLNAGGEGLMLHKADAPYLTGRNPALLKLKPVQDAEAVVVAHLPGKGRWQGQLGALLVELPDGRRLRLGSGLSAAERASPPAVGDTVTYRFRGVTQRGMPRFASYWRQAAP